MKGQTWIERYAMRISDYSHQPLDTHLQGAEEEFGEAGDLDTVEAAEEALRLWEAEGAELADQFGEGLQSV